MRNVAMLLGGLAFVVAACGGQREGAAPAGDTAAAAPPPAAATHDVNMVMEGTTYSYVPAELMIRPGDRVNFHNVSGGPHNVQFWPDSIPAGAAEPLGAGMPDQMAPLAGPLLVEMPATYTITFANVPAGEYKFYCLPHLANKMTGKITVQ
jgi:plastocyanin